MMSCDSCGDFLDDQAKAQDIWQQSTRSALMSYSRLLNTTAQTKIRTFVSFLKLSLKLFCSPPPMQEDLSAASLIYLVLPCLINLRVPHNQFWQLWYKFLLSVKPEAYFFKRIYYLALCQDSIHFINPHALHTLPTTRNKFSYTHKGSSKNFIL